jgi:hypothetical protein
MFESGLKLGPSELQVINVAVETSLSGYEAVFDATQQQTLKRM